MYVAKLHVHVARAQPPCTYKMRPRVDGRFVRMCARTHARLSHEFTRIKSMSGRPRGGVAWVSTMTSTFWRNRLAYCCNSPAAVAAIAEFERSSFAIRAKTSAIANTSFSFKDSGLLAKYPREYEREYLFLSRSFNINLA